MKKGKIAITIVIGIMVFILTMVIFVQFKTISQTDINSIENLREDELREEIAALKTKCEETEMQLLDTNTKINEYNETINTKTEASNLFQEELAKFNNLSGKNTVIGEGIIVTLTDTAKGKKIVASDLLTLLNELKAAGAEAISINEQRIVYNSYVVDLNQTFISVNGAKIVSPYIVKAIGNMSYLESGLAKKQYGYIDKKRAEDKTVELERSSSITIPKYIGSLDFNYIKEESK